MSGTRPIGVSLRGILVTVLFYLPGVYGIEDN